MANSQITRANAGAAAQMRRYYESLKAPFTSSARARRDILALLEERKVVHRAAEKLLNAAQPYAGDANVKAAIDEFRAVLEARATK